MLIRMLKGMAKTVIPLTALLLSTGCGGGGGGGTTAGGGTGGGTTGSLTLTGQVAVSSSDALLAAPASGSPKSAPISFLTKANSILPSATVSLYKVFANTTTAVQVPGITTTTDQNGRYTLTGVPAAVTGTGAGTDYYYEVRATSASGSLDVRAPAAPTADTTVNLSPETKVVAKMLTRSAQSGQGVLPNKEMIENLRGMVFANLSSMSKTFNPPSVATSADPKMAIAASALSSNNGNAEKLIRAYEAHKERIYLEQNRTTVPPATVAAHLDRISTAACNFNGNFKLPQVASSALASAFKNGTSFSLNKVVTAFNNNRDTAVSPTTVTGAISNFSNILGNLNSAFTNKTDIPDNAMLGLYANRGDLTSLSSSTRLNPGQAINMVQAMLPSNQQCQGGVNYTGLVSDLVGNTTIKTTPSFADIEVYHQMLPNCVNGSSLEVRAKVYVPQGVTVSSVTVSAPGLQYQNGTPAANAALVNDTFPSYGTSNWRWTGGQGPNNAAICLAFNQSYTFTITANLSAGGPLTTTVTRKVLNIPEASITLIAKDFTESTTTFTQASTGQPTAPIKLTSALSTQRPLFKWLPAPGAQSAVAIGAPAGTKIKYLYDVTHFRINPLGGGGPETADFVNCPGQQNNTRFYEKDFILSPIECDVNKCNAAVQSAPHVCRLHVQTVLVDEYDRTLGWSAGADMYYCIQGQSNCQ